MHGSHSSLCRFFGFLLPHVDVLSCQTCPKQYIPVDEERLREIRLDTNNLQHKYKSANGRRYSQMGVHKNLMMNVMIICIVSAHKLKRVEREPISTMVVDRL